MNRPFVRWQPAMNVPQATPTFADIEGNHWVLQFWNEELDSFEDVYPEEFIDRVHVVKLNADKPKQPQTTKIKDHGT